MNNRGECGYCEYGKVKKTVNATCSACHGFGHVADHYSSSEPQYGQPDRIRCRSCDGRGSLEKDVIEDCHHCGGCGYSDGGYSGGDTGRPRPRPIGPVINTLFSSKDAVILVIIILLVAFFVGNIYYKEWKFKRQRADNIETAKNEEGERKRLIAQKASAKLLYTEHKKQVRKLSGGQKFATVTPRQATAPGVWGGTLICGNKKHEIKLLISPGSTEHKGFVVISPHPRKLALTEYWSFPINAVLQGKNFSFSPSGKVNGKTGMEPFSASGALVSAYWPLINLTSDDGKCKFMVRGGQSDADEDRVMKQM